MRYYSSTAGATTLASSCSDTATTIELSATAGLPSQFPFTLVVDAGTISEEIVTVTALSGTSAVVVRGEDGSGAQAHQTGAAVRHMASARDFREPQQHMAATVAHGVSSNLVGVSDTQTLSNKTLDTSTQVVVDGAPVALSTALAASGFNCYVNAIESGNVPGNSLSTGLVVLSIPDPGFDYRLLVHCTVMSSISISAGAAFAVACIGTVVGGPNTDSTGNLDVFSLGWPNPSQTFYWASGTGLGIKTYRGPATIRLSIDKDDTYQGAKIRASALVLPA